MSLTEADIKRIVKETLAEERRNTDAQMDDAIIKATISVLSGFGIDDDERKEFKEDFRYTRRLRKASEKLTGMTLTAAVTLVVGAFGSMIYVGFKTLMGKG